MQTASNGSDQSAHMRRLIWGFAGRIFHIVENLMLQLIWKGTFLQGDKYQNCMRTGLHELAYSYA